MAWPQLLCGRVVLGDGGYRGRPARRVVRGGIVSPAAPGRLRRARGSRNRPSPAPRQPQHREHKKRRHRLPINDPAATHTAKKPSPPTKMPPRKRNEIADFTGCAAVWRAWKIASSPTGPGCAARGFSCSAPGTLAAALARECAAAAGRLHRVGTRSIALTQHRLCLTRMPTTLAQRIRRPRERARSAPLLADTRRTIRGKRIRAIPV